MAKRHVASQEPEPKRQATQAEDAPFSQTMNATQLEGDEVEPASSKAGWEALGQEVQQKVIAELGRLCVALSRSNDVLTFKELSDAAKKVLPADMKFANIKSGLIDCLKEQLLKTLALEFVEIQPTVYSVTNGSTVTSKVSRGATFFVVRQALPPQHRHNRDDPLVKAEFMAMFLVAATVYMSDKGVLTLGVLAPVLKRVGLSLNEPIPGWPTKNEAIDTEYKTAAYNRDFLAKEKEITLDTHIDRWVQQKYFSLVSEKAEKRREDKYICIGERFFSEFDKGEFQKKLGEMCNKEFTEQMRKHYDSRDK